LVESLKSYAENATDGIYISDLKGTFLYGNKRAEKIIGYKRQELIGKSFLKLNLLPTKHLAKAAKLLALNAMGKPTGPDEFALRRKNGSRIWVEITTTAVNKGRGVAVIGLVRDITERKRAEEKEKQLQQQLNLSSRLASIGQLAAGVAHEINNPLTGILGFSERLLRKCDEEARTDLTRIHSEAKRAANTVQNLLTFARQREPKKEYSDINDILQKALELRAYELKTSNIEVVADLAPGPPKIMVDFYQIEEVFLNIILNAEQAMVKVKKRGNLSIRTQQTRGYIRISFANDGPGIPAEHLDKLFDPFFTTRRESGGTGLGLSVCHGIVTEHGGRIYIRSKPGKGIIFLVELPITAEDKGI
jgi:PAS domain S-box-containing protein